MERVKNKDKDEPNGRFSIVGVGPGDPELMTVKAVRTLERADVLVTPKGKANGNSTARRIVEGLVDIGTKEICELHFPMHKVRLGRGEQDSRVTAAWQRAADAILFHLDRGREVVFPTLGDPALYSTGFYVLTTLKSRRPELRITLVPGITAMSGCSARAELPLGLGDDLVTVVPAVFADERLREILRSADSIVLMKVHRSMERIIGLLDEMGLTEQATLFERCGLDGETIHPDIRQVKNPHYFSTILIRKKNLAP